MSDRLPPIVISAVDQASDDFQRVGQNAQKMGQQLTQAGKTAGQGLKQVGNDAKTMQAALAQADRQTQQTAQGLDDLHARAVAVGAGIGTAIAGLALAGQAYNQQQISIRGLQAAYGDATDEIVQFSKFIQQNTIYSDDQARQAAQIASTLVRNYGLSTDAVEQLILRSADLASVSLTETGQQFTLADAVQRTTAAIRGEGESAEALGLTMNQQAIDRDGLTLTMTNQEAAQFRLNALMEQSTFAEGQAAAAADTHAGHARQLLNVLQDQEQRVGGLIGPFGQYLSVLGDVALAAPLAGAGIGRIAGAARAAVPALTGIAGALGPVGLIAAGVGAVAILGDLTDWFGFAGDNAEAAAPNVQSLADAVLALAQAGEDVLIINQVTNATTLLGQALDAIDADTYQSQVQGAVDAAQALGDQFGVTTQQINDAILNNTQTGVQAVDDQIAQIHRLVAAADAETAGAEQTAVDLSNTLIGRLNEPLIDSGKALGDYLLRVQQLKDGVITIAEFNVYLQDMVTNFSSWYGQIPEAVDAQAALNDQLAIGARLIDDNADASNRRGTALQGETSTIEGLAAAEQAYNDELTVRSRLITDDGEASNRRGTALQGSTAQIEAEAAATEENNQRTDLMAALKETAADAIDRFRGSVKAEADALHEANQAVIDFVGDSEHILRVLYEAGKGLSGEQGFIRDVLDLQASLGALDTTYGIIIDGSEALGKTTKSLADHYSELVGVYRDVNGAIYYQTSLIDDLVARGVIDTSTIEGQQEYGAAVAATTQILNDNARVQDAIAKIQVDQAPYLANLNAETAEYVENLSQQDAQQQRNVLTLMDANSQQQLAGLYAAATSAEMGELGDNGKQYVDDMAAGLKVTNPLLYDMLVQTGAIKEDADGIHFNFDDTDALSMVEVLDGLNETLEDLIDVIDELNGKEINPKINDKAAKAFAGFAANVPQPAVYAGDATGGPEIAPPVVSGAAAPIVVPVTADTSGINAAVGDARSAIEQGLTRHEWKALILGDPSGATTAATDAGTAIGRVVDTDYTAEIGGDNSGALEATGGAQQALGDLDGSSATVYIGGDPSNFYNTVNSINGQIVGSAYIQINGTRGAGLGGIALRHGGIVPEIDHAQHGLISRGMRRVMTDEAGPEIKILPDRTAVIPAPLSNSIMRGQGKGGGDIYIEHLYITESSGSVYDTLVSAAYGSNR